MIKRIFLILLIITLFSVSGCKDNKKLYLPEAENDKIFTIVGNE